MSEEIEKSAKILTKDITTPQLLGKLEEGLSRLGKGELERYGRAFRDDDCKGMTLEEKTMYGIVSFIFGTADPDYIKRLAAIFGLDSGAVKAIRGRLFPKGGKHIAEQLVLPFDNWPREMPQLTICNCGPYTHTSQARFPVSKLAKGMTVFDLEKSGRDDCDFVIANSRKIRGKRKKEVFIPVSLTSTKITSARNITFFDRMVEDAIGNLADDGNMDPSGVMGVTPEVIYRQLAGLGRTDYIPAEAIEQINESVDRLAKTWITADLTPQAKLGGEEYAKLLDENGKLLLDSPIIHAEKASIVYPNNKKPRVGWKIIGMPKIYQYSKDFHQIAVYDRKVLTAGDVKNTDLAKKIRYYLLQEIDRLKFARNKSAKGKHEGNSVLYRSIFEAIGEDLPGKATEKDAWTEAAKKTRARRLELVKKILDGLKGIGEIADWKEGQKREMGLKTGVVIVLGKDEQPPRKNQG